MITISRLDEATDAAVNDINLLLPQVRLGPSQHAVSLFDLQAIVASHGTAVIVAKDEQRIVGMATIHIVTPIGRRIAHVDDVVVSDGYRRQGLATKIMRELTAFAKSRGVSQLRLTSRSARIAANQFYRQTGFIVGNTNVFVMNL
jgi:ribosomal protein S18 acetylase RimI-like enzyme